MKKGINRILGAFIMGTALMAVPSCTDTWEEHYNAEDTGSADKTLWELLEEREDLSSFRNIVSKAKYYRDEGRPAFTMNGSDTVFYTYKDILSGNSPVTVWAPKNDALTAEEWARYEQMAETNAYNLQQQFISNHMALFRKTMTKTGKETIRLINNKFATLDYDNGLIQKSAIKEKNIGASNGLLHIIDSENEFLYNLYEYIKFSGVVNTFKEYLVQRDTLIFMQGSSIEGLPDANGNPTYVDSVYFQDNLMFSRSSYDPTGADSEEEWMTRMKMFNAQISTEDSAFVMIVPTDKAWAEARAKLAPYYKYADAYPKMNKLRDNPETKQRITIEKAKHAFPCEFKYGTTDSLQRVNIDMDIVYPLVFNARLQRGNGGQDWRNAQQFIENYKNCKYLLTTTGDTIRDVYDEAGNLIWSKNSLFEDGTVEIKEMSNGIAILTDSWNYGHNYWMRDLEMETDYYYKNETAGAGTSAVYFEVNNNATANWINQYGKCSRQACLHVYNSDPQAENVIVFPLDGSKLGQANVMSAKYDIQIVVVPYWYSNTEEPEIEAHKNKFTCTLYYWDEDYQNNKYDGYKYQKKVTMVTDPYKNEKVDTITIFEDFQFPVSYRNQKYSYPFLEIKTNAKRADIRRGFSNSFKIDQIILKCKESE